jgi:hypothetical protein
MIKLSGVILLMSLVIACNNSGSNAGSSDTTKSSDTTTINTNPENMTDGGPNQGLGDTNSYNRMNDTLSSDTTHKKRLE